MITQLDIFYNDPLKLPGAVAAPNGTDSVTSIQNHIDIYEKEMLINSLGLELYNIVVAQYADLENADQRIKDLVNGVSYTVENRSVKWEGLKNYSFLPYYIYWKYIQEKQDIFTTFGVERPEGVNSVGSSSIYKANKIYNDFLSFYQGVDEPPRFINTSYGFGLDFQNSISPMRSFYQFLSDKKDTYPEVTSFKFYLPLNSFGV